MVQKYGTGDWDGDWHLLCHGNMGLFILSSLTFIKYATRRGAEQSLSLYTVHAPSVLLPVTLEGCFNKYVIC